MTLLPTAFEGNRDQKAGEMPYSVFLPVLSPLEGENGPKRRTERNWGIPVAGRVARLTANKAIIRWRQERKACIKAKGNRLALLIKWAAVKVAPNKRSKSYQESRSTSSKCFIPARNRTGECWSCRCLALLFWHHVIQLQNGGTNWNLNAERICHDCHAKIHPWLNKISPGLAGAENATKPQLKVK